ncbi:Glutathione S-transferase [Klebsiella pneumoniae]|nr:Glutathione S-transferase [Klebsiella pneumoniae]
MITLWGRNNSTNVKKVRWVLEELDLPYQQILAGWSLVSTMTRNIWR